MMKLSCRRVTLVMTSLVVAMVAPLARGQIQNDSLCCDVQPTCKNVSTLNISMSQFLGKSPYYETIMSSDYLSDTYRGVCTTYFQMSVNLYLAFRTIKGQDGSIDISILLYTDVPGQNGVFRVQGLLGGNSSLVYTSYVVDVVCESCQPIYMYYKCYNYDICGFVDSEFNDVNAKSPSPSNDASCLDTFASLAVSKGFNVRGFVRPPTDCYSCVTQYGNNYCLNYDTVKPEFRITYPLNSGC